MWNILAERTDLSSSGGDIWRGIQRTLTLTKEAASTGLWNALSERSDATQYCPHAIPDVAEEPLKEGDQQFFVICSPRGNYLRLSPIQRDLWRQMDGSKTVGQLATWAFLQHQQLVPVGDLVALLKNEGFLTEQSTNLYHMLTHGLEERSAEGWGRRVLRVLASRTFSLPNIDAIYSVLYRAFGRMFFSWAFLALWSITVLAGLIVFGGIFFGGLASYEVLGKDSSVVSELLALWAMLLVSFVCHESAHALTVKHFGRILHGGGVMLYFGMPAAYVDTSDMWRSPRRARMLVSAAGPMSDLLIGSIASLAALALARGDTSSPLAVLVGALFFKLAIACYVAVAFNANPLLELDGYFILVDWLRMPDLRRRALAFVSGPLWQKLTNRLAGKLDREERILSLYGVLTVIYTIVAVVGAAIFWQAQLEGSIRRLLVGEWWEQIIGWLLLLVVVLPIVAACALAAWGTVRVSINWLVQRGYGRRPELLAAAGILLVGLLTFLTTRIDGSPAYWVAPVLWGIALAALIALQPDYRGAAIAPALLALLLTTICSALAAAMRAFETPYWVIPEALAFVFILLAGFAALLDVELRFVPPAELLSTAILLIVSFAFGAAALVLSEQNRSGESLMYHITASAPAYFGSLALALMLPRLFDLRDSRLNWSWVLLWVGTLAETLGYLINLVVRIPALDVVVAGLWAVAWLVHLATLRQITPDEMHWDHVPSINESQRLVRAFQCTYAGCYRLLREVYGERRSRAFDDRMDVIAATADWDVTLDRDRARVSEVLLKLPLDEIGSRFAEVLRYTVLMIEEITGHVFARRAIQAAYDALPWPERETASRLCFPDTPWARQLSNTFGDVRGVRMRLLRQVDLFLNCDDAELEALAHTIEEQRVGANTILLRNGHASPGVWVIEAGEILVRKQNQIVEELHRGDAFGAHELIENRPSDATYRSTIECVLLFIPAAEYLEVSRERAPHASEAIESAEIVRLLERVPLFADMPRNTLRGLAHIAQRRELPSKSVVVRQGQPSGVFYIIQHGQAAILARDVGQTQAGTSSLRIIATLGVKEFFGELELLHGTPPMAHVVTTMPSVLLALPHEAIRALLLGDGGLARSLEQIGSGRLLSAKRG